MEIQRIIGALMMAAVLGAIGFFVGEYAPFTGGLASIAEPFSIVRNQTAAGYAIVGGIIGIIIGMMIRTKKEHIAVTDSNTMSEGMKKCPYCAEMIKNEAITCKHCGRDLTSPQKRVAPQIPTNPTVASSPADVSFCSSCGKPVANNVKFCTHCGNPK